MKKKRIQSILLGVLVLTFHMRVHAMRERSSSYNPPPVKNVQSSLPPVRGTAQVQGVTTKAEPQTQKSPGFFDRMKSSFKEWQTGRELKSVEKRIDSVKNTIETRPGLQNNPLRKKELNQKLSDLETQQQTLKDTQQRRALKKEERTGQLTDENKILFEVLKQKKWGAEAERLEKKQQDLSDKEKKLSSSESKRLDKATQKIEESNEALANLKKKQETIEQEKTTATDKVRKILGISTPEAEKTPENFIEKSKQSISQSVVSESQSKPITKLLPPPSLSEWRNIDALTPKKPATPLLKPEPEKKPTETGTKLQELKKLQEQAKTEKVQEKQENTEEKLKAVQQQNQLSSLPKDLPGLQPTKTESEWKKQNEDFERKQESLLQQKKIQQEKEDVLNKAEALVKQQREEQLKQKQKKEAQEELDKILRSID